MNSPVSTSEDQKEQKRHLLTQEDVSRLLNEPVAETRIEVASKLASDHAAGKFRPNELLVAEQIFRLLLRDTEVRVRAALADNLKEDDDAPKDVIRQLAEDVDEVSLPVLETSKVLTDEDLLEIISKNEAITKHIAIANRDSVSNAVSAALIDTENEEVVTHLVKNEGADISQQGYDKIISDFRESTQITSVVVKRANLPVTVVENLLNIVSDSVAEELKQKYGEVSRKLDEEAKKTRETMTLSLLDATQDPEEVQALVDQMYASDRLTPSIILTALCRGNFSFFEISLAKMAKIPTSNAHKLINDKGELGFKSLYGKAGLPESMFDACRLVLSVMREMHENGDDAKPGSIHYANRAVEKIFMRSEGRDIDNLAYIIALIRQNVR